MGKDIIISEALAFSIQITRGNGVMFDRATYKSGVEESLYSYSRNSDKLKFLTTLAKAIKDDLDVHEKTCKQNPCRKSDMANAALYAIGELTDDVSDSLKFEEPSDKFTIDEIVDLHRKIDLIIEMLKETNAGNEVLFEDIEDLKNQTYQGREAFKERTLGKFAKWALEKVIDGVVVSKAVNIIASNGEEAIKKLDGFF